MAKDNVGRVGHRALFRGMRPARVFVMLAHEPRRGNFALARS